MAVPEGFMDMQHAAQQAALSPSVIRMWELRYRWPQPKRMANGYRVYTPHQVAELRRVGEFVKAGMSIGQLVDKDGNLTLPKEKDRRPARCACPWALTKDAASVPEAAEVIGAVAGGDYGAAVRVIVESERMRPDRRDTVLMAAFRAVAEVTCLGYDRKGIEDVARAAGDRYLPRIPAADIVGATMASYREQHGLAGPAAAG